MDRKVYGPGSVIFKEGQRGHCAYLVEKGRVEISVLRNGRNRGIAVLGVGEVFGEMALLDDEVRSATACTVTETVLVPIDRAMLEQRFQQADPMLSLLLRVVLKRFRQTQYRMLSHEEGTSPDDPLLSGTYERSFDEAHQEAFREIALNRELQRALDQEQFVLYYQPIVDLESAGIRGFEALIRWIHPERGFIPPNQFVGLAEKTDLILGIGRWVLRRACADLPRMQERGGSDLFVSVNVSGRQLRSLEEVDALCAIARQADIHPGRLKLEITESLLIEDPEFSALALQRFKELGASLALDDFGTGYSSLTYLHRFPLDTLKVDRSFVSTLLRDISSGQIIKAMAGLAEALEMDVVAEGIEEPAEIRRLCELGCPLGQGYLFSRPVPLKEALELLGRPAF